MSDERYRLTWASSFMLILKTYYGLIGVSYVRVLLFIVMSEWIKHFETSPYLGKHVIRASFDVDFFSIKCCKFL